MVSLIDDDPDRCPWCRRQQPQSRAATAEHMITDIVLWRFGRARYRWAVVCYGVWLLVLAYTVWPEPPVRLWVPAGVAVATLAVCHLPRAGYELVRLARR